MFFGSVTTSERFGNLLKLSPLVNIEGADSLTTRVILLSVLTAVRVCWFYPKGAICGLLTVIYIYPASSNRGLKVAYNKSVPIWLKNRYYWGHVGSSVH